MYGSVESRVCQIRCQEAPPPMITWNDGVTEAQANQITGGGRVKAGSTAIDGVLYLGLFSLCHTGPTSVL